MIPAPRQWSVGTLDAGATASITLTTTVPVTPGAPSTIVNAATVENPEFPPPPVEECVANDDLVSDTDQCDTIETPLTPKAPPVVPEKPQPKPEPKPSGPLAVTGGDVPVLAIGAASAMALAGATLLLIRRRKTADAVASSDQQ